MGKDVVTAILALSLAGCPASPETAIPPSTTTSTPVGTLTPSGHPAPRAPRTILIKRTERGKSSWMERVAIPGGRVIDTRSGASGLDQLHRSPDSRWIAWGNRRRIRIGRTKNFPTVVDTIRLPQGDYLARGMAWSARGTALGLVSRKQLDDVDFDGPSRYHLRIWRPGRPIERITFDDRRFIGIVAFDAVAHRLYYTEPVDGGGWSTLTVYDYESETFNRVGEGGPARRLGPRFTSGMRYLWWLQAPEGTESFTQIFRHDLMTKRTIMVYELPASRDPRRQISGFYIGAKGDRLLLNVVSSKWSQDEIILLRLGANGDSTRRISVGSEWCHHPHSWSPDGRYIFMGPYSQACETSHLWGLYDLTQRRMVLTLSVPRRPRANPDEPRDNRGAIGFLAWLPPGWPG